MSSEVLLTLYYSLIHSQLSYCNIVWASERSGRLDSVWLLQKRAMRAVFKLRKFDSTKHIFKQCSILSVYNINTLQTALIMYQLNHGLILSKFTNPFVKVNSIHTYNTRQADLLYVPGFRTKKRQFAFSIMGPHVWNSIPKSIRDLTSLFSFKRVYKELLLNTT